MKEHTLGPWAWQQMGDWKLVGQHGMRPIVLATRGVRKSPGPPPPAVFVLRDAERDLMIPFDPDHPDARVLAAAPDLLEACAKAEAGICDWRLGAALEDHKDYRHMTAAEPYLKSVLEALRAAMAKAAGR